MTDLLTPDERELVEEARIQWRDIDPKAPGKLLIAIIDRLAPKPQPPAPLTLWAVYTQDNVKICATDDEDTAHLIANRRNARVVKMVEATP